MKSYKVWLIIQVIAMVLQGVSIGINPTGVLLPIRIIILCILAVTFVVYVINRRSNKES